MYDDGDGLSSVCCQGLLRPVYNITISLCLYFVFSKYSWDFQTVSPSRVPSHKKQWYINVIFCGVDIVLHLN